MDAEVYVNVITGTVHLIGKSGRTACGFLALGDYPRWKLETIDVYPKHAPGATIAEIQASIDRAIWKSLAMLEKG